MAIGTWFATEFDDPVPSREIPAVFTSGSGPEVLVADRVSRGKAIVGRVNAESGAVALKVRTDGRPVRVRADLHVDGASQAAWARAVSPGWGARELPRLVTVRAQGTTRAAALMSRPRGRLRMREAHAWVEFDLRADEVVDGLLILEVADARLPQWASLSPLAAVGVRINRVEVAAIEEVGAGKGSGRRTGLAAQLDGSASAGGLAGAKSRREGSPRSRFVVVNANSSSVRVRLRTASTSAAPPADHHPRRRWLRRRKVQKALRAVQMAQRGAGYALFEASPFGRPPHPERLNVRAASVVDGADIPVHVTAQGDDVLDVLIECETPGPVLVGLADPAAAAMRRRVSNIVCQIVDLEW